jgi:hypothetical protein
MSRRSLCEGKTLVARRRVAFGEARAQELLGLAYSLSLEVSAVREIAHELGRWTDAH